MDLMEAAMYPTSPALSPEQGTSSVAPITPVSTTVNSAPVAIILIRSPGLTEPSFTLM